MFVWLRKLSNNPIRMSEKGLHNIIAGTLIPVDKFLPLTTMFVSLIKTSICSFNYEWSLFRRVLLCCSKLSGSGFIGITTC